MATTRPPHRTLSQVLSRVSPAVEESRRKGFQNVMTHSANALQNPAAGTARGHVETLVSPHGIGPLRQEPYRGFWFVRKPAMMAMRHRTAGEPELPATHRPWTIERYLKESPVVAATFRNGERLSVVHGLPRAVSGIIPITVDSKLSSATAEPPVVMHRYELLVWGHLRRTTRPLRFEEFGASWAPYVGSPSRFGANAMQVNSGFYLTTSTSMTGYYAGRPVTHAWVTLQQPPAMLMEDLDWSKLAARALAPLVLDGSPQTAEGAVRIVGTEADKALDIPRLMVNLTTVRVRTEDSESTVQEIMFDAKEFSRFRQVIAPKPAVDIAGTKFAARRSLV